MTAWTWMRHPKTGGTQRFAAAAVPAWQAEGWEPCDPPAGTNLAIGPNHPALAVMVAEIEAAERDLQRAAESGTLRTGRRTTGRASATEEKE